MNTVVSNKTNKQSKSRKKKRFFNVLAMVK